MTVVKDVYISATGCSSIRRVETEESYSMISARATIECDATTLTMGDTVTIDAGYADSHGVLFFGYVKRIEYVRPDNVIRISCNDELVKAVDFFIAADDPEAPFQRNNISSLNLVEDVLALASVTNVSGTEPGFTWGTNSDGVRFNLQTVADAAQSIANIVGYTLYADKTGAVFFVARKPYVEEADTPSHTFSTGSSGNIVDITYSVSTDSTRNIIKVYGRNPITAQASGSNQYLVVDQTVVLAHEMIDSQEIADGAASVNLALLNRLSESFEITVLGDKTVQAREIATVTDSWIGASAREVFIYRALHTISESDGYQLNLTCIP